MGVSKKGGSRWLVDVGGCLLKMGRVKVGGCLYRQPPTPTNPSSILFFQMKGLVVVCKGRVAERVVECSNCNEMLDRMGWWLVDTDNSSMRKNLDIRQILFIIR